MSAWTAPDPGRPPTAQVGDERTTLESFLEYQRHTLLMKCAGLTAEQLCQRAVEPSIMSLAGLLRHMRDVEVLWFLRCMGKPWEYRYYVDDDGDAEFVSATPEQAEEDWGALVAAFQASRESAQGHALEESFHFAEFGEDFTLRWIYAHMIEEFARHNGHADLLRERIDGATGE